MLDRKSKARMARTLCWLSLIHSLCLALGSNPSCCWGMSRFPTAQIDPDDIYKCAVDADIMSCARVDGTIISFNIKTGEELSAIKVAPSFQAEGIFIIGPKDKKTMVVQGAVYADRPRVIVAAYDLIGGKQIPTFRVGKQLTTKLLGFSRDGKTAYWELAVSGVVAVDWTTSEEKWFAGEIKRPYEFLKASAEGEKFAVREYARRPEADKNGDRPTVDIAIEGRDPVKGRIWRVEMPDTRPAVNGNNIALPTQSLCAGPLVVFNSSTERLLALSMDSGETLWQMPFTSARDVQAISRDGNVFIGVYDGNRKIVFPKENRTIRLLVDEKSALTLGGDGKHIIALPPLKTVSFDKDKNIEHLQRQSNIIKVIDTATGNVEREINPWATNQP